MAVVWAISHLKHYLYNQHITLTIHITVKFVLPNPNISRKHARWWLKVYGSGLKNIIHRTRIRGSNVDALSRNPYVPAPTEAIGESEVQIDAVSENTIDDDVDDISTQLC